MGQDVNKVFQLSPDDIANKIITMMICGPSKTGVGGPSAVSLKESAELIFNNLDKVERNVLLVGKDGKIWEKTLSPLTQGEIDGIIALAVKKSS